jgi:hypothetical protein
VASIADESSRATLFAELLMINAPARRSGTGALAASASPPAGR